MMSREMTNKEAIARLAYIKTHQIDPEDYEVFDLAIKALEEPEVYLNGKDYNLYLEGYKQGKKDFERPQGEWVGNAFDEHHCNRCGHPALWEEEPDNYYEVQSNFCPNCGAEMKGGAE